MTYSGDIHQKAEGPESGHDPILISVDDITQRRRTTFCTNPSETMIRRRFSSATAFFSLDCSNL